MWCAFLTFHSFQKKEFISDINILYSYFIEISNHLHEKLWLLILCHLNLNQVETSQILKFPGFPFFEKQHLNMKKVAIANLYMHTPFCKCGRSPLTSLDYLLWVWGGPFTNFMEAEVLPNSWSGFSPRISKAVSPPFWRRQEKLTWQIWRILIIRINVLNSKTLLRQLRKTFYLLFLSSLG